MAMAAVRLAARRLTGQQPQAIVRSAFQNEQALLNRGGSPAYALRRFTSSEASVANRSRINTEHPSVSGDSRLKAADQKKEELCDLLHEIQMDKDIPRARRKKDRWLLQRLTSHVDPRPSNPEWQRYLGENTINRWVGGTTIVFSFLYMTEKLGEFLIPNKQVQGADSDRASVSSVEPNVGE